MNDKKLFGPAANCRNLAELVPLERRVVGDGAIRAVVAYGMLMGARFATPGNRHDDALAVLDGLGAAKMELDKAACHALPAVLVTAELLAGAQAFVDESTTGCNEWPTSDEVVARVAENAAKYAFAGPWKQLVFGSRGEVVGMEPIVFD